MSRDEEGGAGTPATTFTPDVQIIPTLAVIPVGARRRAERLGRHPLLASALADGDSRLDFECFVGAFLADLNPAGAVETTIAARAAGLAWRLNRAQAIESAFLSKPNSRTSRIDEALDNRRDVYVLEGIHRWEMGLQRALARTLDDLERHRASRRTRGLTLRGGAPTAEDVRSTPNDTG